MKTQTRKIVLYITGIFLLISGILGIILPQLGLSTFTSVVWAVLGAVFHSDWLRNKCKEDSALRCRDIFVHSWHLRN